MRPERKVLSPGKALLACAAVLLPALSATTAAALPLHRRAARLTTGRTTLVGKQAREGHKSQPAPAPALRVTSVTPADGATGVGPEGPVTVTFSAPLAPSSPMPSVSPEGAGTWTRNAPNKLTFRPSLPFVPLSRLTLTVPGGKAGVEGSDGSHLARTIKASFQVRDGTVLRLQQVLSLLDYSPLAWVPRGKAVPGTGTAAQLEAFYKPPAGTFRWRQAAWRVQRDDGWFGHGVPGRPPAHPKRAHYGGAVGRPAARPGRPRGKHRRLRLRLGQQGSSRELHGLERRQGRAEKPCQHRGRDSRHSRRCLPCLCSLPPPGHARH